VGTSFGIFLAVLALAGGLIYRRRLAGLGTRNGPLTDDMIRRIEEEGRLPMDDEEDALDMKHIREEEERFLDETWDEPDE
jgi:hypothetical protein